MGELRKESKCPSLHRVIRVVHNPAALIQGSPCAVSFSLIVLFGMVSWSRWPWSQILKDGWSSGDPCASRSVERNSCSSFWMTKDFGDCFQWWVFMSGAGCSKENIPPPLRFWKHFPSCEVGESKQLRLNNVDRLWNQSRAQPQPLLGKWWWGSWEDL